MKSLACLTLLAPLCLAGPVVAQVASPLRPITPAQAAASPSAEPSALALYLAGNAAAGDARYDVAAGYFARAADMATGEARDSLRETAFESAVQGGDIAQAARLAPQNADGSQSAHQLGQLVLAVDALASGDAAKATTILSSNTLAQPFRATAQMLLPWAQAAAGDKSMVIPAIPTRASAAAQVYAAYNRAKLLEFTGQNDKVDDAYRDLVRMGPDFLDFQYSYADFLQRQNRLPEALKVYDAILAKVPDDPRATRDRDRVRARRPQLVGPLTAQQGAAETLISQGTIALAQNDSDSALAYLWLALRLDEHRTNALDMAASIEASAGANEAAREHFAKIPVDAPEYVDARINIAETWLADHDTDKALAAARETASKAPHDLDAKISLAGFLAVAGKSADAVNEFTQVIRAKGDDASWSLYYARATAYNDRNDWADAEKDLTKALQLAPDEPEVMNYLGFMWADRNERLPEALVLLQKAAAAKPNEGAIIDSLGWVYYRMGDFPKAIDNLEKAVELDAADPSVNDHLGDAYMGAGRKLEALYQWQRVLTLHPDDKLKAAVQKKINTEKASASTVASANSPAPVTP